MNQFAKHSDEGAKQLPSQDEKTKQINDADVAELVDARDLKFPAGTDLVEVSCKTLTRSPIEADGTNRDLQNTFDDGPHHDLGLENARRYFIAQREFEGADTPIGHRWSNLVELAQAIYGSVDPVQREHCMVSFAKNLGEILDLKLSQPTRQLSRQQLLLAYSTNTFH